MSNEAPLAIVTDSVYMTPIRKRREEFHREAKRNALVGKGHEDIRIANVGSEDESTAPNFSFDSARLEKPHAEVFRAEVTSHCTPSVSSDLDHQEVDESDASKDAV